MLISLYNLTYIICILHNNSAISSVHSKQSQQQQHKMFLKFFILIILTQISLGAHKSNCRQTQDAKKCQKLYGSIERRIKLSQLSRKEIYSYPFLNTEKSYGLKIRNYKTRILNSIDPSYFLVESEKNAQKTMIVENNNIAMSITYKHNHNGVISAMTQHLYFFY